MLQGRCYRGDQRAGRMSFGVGKNGCQDTVNRPGLKATLESPAQEGQDVHNQLALLGAAFSLTSDLFSDTVVAHTPGTEGTEP